VGFKSGGYGKYKKSDGNFTPYSFNSSKVVLNLVGLPLLSFLNLSAKI
jgi:hypothetical protein